MLALSKKEYNKRFEGDKPLMDCPKENYPDRMYFRSHGFDGRKNCPKYMFDFMWTNYLTESYPPLIFAIDAEESELTTYDILYTRDGGAVFLIHQRVVDILLELCPNDVQIFEAMIKNFDPKKPAFENHDFYVVNILHTVEALDLEKSKYEIEEDGFFWLNYRVFKEEPCMGDHLIAREHHNSDILFHPKLAKRLKDCKRIRFLRDEDSRF